MGQNLKESQSLGYILKQWFKKTLEFQNSFLKYFQSFQSKSQDEITHYSVELQRFLGKTKTRQCGELRKQLLQTISNMELEVLELLEFLLQYKVHLEYTDNYEVKFPTLNRIKEHVSNNYETIESFQTYLDEWFNHYNYERPHCGVGTWAVNLLRQSNWEKTP